MESSQASSDAPSSSSQNEWSRGHGWCHVPERPTLHVSSLHSEGIALLLIFATVSVVALNRMRQRIQLPERDEYNRIVARVQGHASAGLWGVMVPMLGHRSTQPPSPRGAPSSICRIKSGKLGRSLVAFHRSDPTLHTLPLPDSDSRHKSLRTGSRDP